MKRQMGKLAYGGTEYRIIYDEESREYKVVERWYVNGWHTKTAGKYETLGEAAEAVTVAVKTIEIVLKAYDEQ